MSLSPEDVQDILNLLDALPVDELDLQTERFRLTLRRGADGQWAQSGTQPEQSAPAPAAPLSAGPPSAEAPVDPSSAVPPSTVPPPAAAPPFAAPPFAAPPFAAEQPSADADPTLAVVRSPLPGTFYRAPKPGAPPFVEVGSRVGADTVIGIVETMKMFNPVPAGLAGRVAAIELADAEFAEQDAVLMRIAPGDSPTSPGRADG